MNNNLFNGNVMSIDNAFVEEVSADGCSLGYATISYETAGAYNMVSGERLRLNIGPDTVILDALGMPVCFWEIQPGMWIDVRFSAAMTRSIPPQSQAYLIAVRRQPMLPAESVTIDRIAAVDVPGKLLYTGNRCNINSQMRFVITDETVIIDKDGTPLWLSALNPGDLVRVTHPNFQTASIPPQTTAFQVQRMS